MNIHIVRQGETLASVAAGYGVDPVRLAADNGVIGDALAVGQTLVIRFPRQVHAVRRGETLASIAAEYGVSVRQLWQNNFMLGGGDHLTPEQTLVISYFGEVLGGKLVNSYAYPYIKMPLLRQELPYLSTLAPFTYGITDSGGLLPLDDAELIAAARSMGVRPVLHLSTLTESGRFDTQRAERVLSDFQTQSEVCAEILRQVRLRGYSGVDVDFEYLPANRAKEYAAFLLRLRGLLRQDNLGFLWAALAPKTSSRQRGLLYEGHDYYLVGAAVDAVLLMTYEWGYTAGPPMAVAPLPNVRTVLDYAVTEISNEKILLGIPNYGYDWRLPFEKGVTRAQSISNQKAIELAVQYRIAIQYDETAQSPFFHYTDENGNVHEVWFEDARSLSAKYRLMAEYQLKGAGIWNLMRPSPQTWQTLAALFEIREL